MIRRTRSERAADLDQMSSMLWERLGPTATVRLRVSFDGTFGRFVVAPDPVGARQWIMRLDTAQEVESYLRKHYEAAIHRAQTAAARTPAKGKYRPDLDEQERRMR